jgi:hypothetical protein
MVGRTSQKAAAGDGRVKNSELRNLAPTGPKKKAKKEGGGTGGLIAQGALAFILAIGGIGLYRNPSLAQGWIPGLGAKKTAVAAAPAKLPAAALAAIADEKAQTKDEPLTQMDEQLALSAKTAGVMMAHEGNTKEQAEIEQAFASSTAHIGGLMETFGTLEGTNIMTVKLYLGGKTSRAMAESCEAASRPKAGAVWYNAEALAKFANCYMTKNVERLCSGAQRKVLSEVIAHYFANRAYWLRQADPKTRGGMQLNVAQGNPKPADWSNPVAKALPDNLRKLVAQGYLSRADFGWFPEEELKPILNETPVEANPCGDQKT